MIHESLSFSSLEYTRSKRIFIFGSLFPTFFINFLFIVSVLFTFFTGSGLSGGLFDEKIRILLLRGFIWELQFLAMFHVTILIPWLYSENNLDIFIFQAITDPKVIILGKLIAIFKQQLIFLIIYFPMGLITFILTGPVSFTLLEIIESLLALFIGLCITDLLVLTITLIIKRLLKSLQIGATIISLYLFAIPLLIIVLISYGFLSSEISILNLPIQLQELNNYLINSNLFPMTINLDLTALISLEIFGSLLIIKIVSIQYE